MYVLDYDQLILQTAQRLLIKSHTLLPDLSTRLDIEIKEEIPIV